MVVRTELPVPQDETGMKASDSWLRAEYQTGLKIESRNRSPKLKPIIQDPSRKSNSKFANFWFRVPNLISGSEFVFQYLVVTHWAFGPVWARYTGPLGQFSLNLLAVRAIPVVMAFQVRTNQNTHLLDTYWSSDISWSFWRLLEYQKLNRTWVIWKTNDVIWSWQDANDPQMYHIFAFQAPKNVILGSNDRSWWYLSE